MTVFAIIPARMASTRFFGKPLAPIHGMPMIEHIYRRAKMCSAIDYLSVATCDKEIVHHMESIGGLAVMTADTHERATDRTAEAVTSIESKTGRKADIVVMIQGDEPMVTPNMLSSLISVFKGNSHINIANLVCEATAEESADKNTVKVVHSPSYQALYFSRSAIPGFHSHSNQLPFKKQLGIIAFRRPYLNQYQQLSPTPLEQAESVDMLRVLEHGDHITLVDAHHPLKAVDTPQDLEVVSAKMAQDQLMHSYL